MIIDDIQTLDSLPHGIPSDMRDEIADALQSGSEAAVEYHREAEYNSEATHWVYFANAGRGGRCAGGDTDWTDCSGLDDLADRWENYADRWCN